MSKQSPFTLTQRYETCYASPLGVIEIVASSGGIISVGFVKKKRTSVRAENPLLRECVRELKQYFKGSRERFQVPVHPEGTEFQRRVWRQLMKVPFGERVSYGDLAAGVGRKKAGRAVGQANARNPIAIIVPCHRVIGTDGGLVGYGGGLWRKGWLLEHKRRSRF